MKWVLVVLVSILLMGCDKPKEVSYSELIELTQSWKKPKVAIWYYQGSDDKYHYVQYLDLGVKEKFMVPKSEFKIQ